MQGVGCRGGALCGRNRTGIGVAAGIWCHSVTFFLLKVQLENIILDLMNDYNPSPVISGQFRGRTTKNKGLTFPRSFVHANKTHTSLSQPFSSLVVSPEAASGGEGATATRNTTNVLAATSGRGEVRAADEDRMAGGRTSLLG